MRSEPVALQIDPGPVVVHEWVQRCGGILAVGQSAEGLHRQLNLRDLHGLGLGDGRAGDPGRAQQAAVPVDHLPLGGHAVTDGVLRRVGVVEIGNPVVPLRSRPPAGVGPGNEGLVACDFEFRLEGVGGIGGSGATRLARDGRPIVHEKHRHRPGSTGESG